MNTWEDILNRYLEGSLLRADAEALRWKIDLPASARAEIDRDLKLADDLAGLSEQIAPEESASAKLIGALRAQPLVEAPSNWSWTAAGPVATSSAQIDESELHDLADVAAELTALGRSAPVPEGAVDRMVARLRQEAADASGDMEGADTRPIVLFPKGMNFKPDALAASKDDEPSNDDEDGRDPADGADRN